MRVLEAAATIGGGTRTARADPPRLPARHLLGDPPARAGLAVPARAAAGRARPRASSTPSCRWPIRSTTAARPRCTARSRRPPTRLRRRRATPTGALIGPLARDSERAAAGDLLGAAAAAAPPARRRALRPLGLRSAAGLARARFDAPRARALIAGNAAHSMLPLDGSPTAAFALVLRCSGHAVGWPVARGGSQAIADALASFAALARRRDRHRARASSRSRSCRRRRRRAVRPHARARSLAIAGERLPGALPPRARALPLRARRLQARLGARRPGPVDRAGVPRGPAPCTSAARSRRSRRPSGVARGGQPERPYVLLAQQSLFDPSRAPAGKHTRGPTATSRTARRAT